MRNLFISLLAVFMAFITKTLGWEYVILVTIILTTYSLGSLLYYAQLLPEALMTYIDNKTIHDGNCHDKKEKKISNIIVNAANEALLSEHPSDTDEHSEKIQSIKNLILVESQLSNIQCSGLEKIESWIYETTPSETTISSQVSEILQKIKQAKGICEHIKLSYQNNKLEVIA